MRFLSTSGICSFPDSALRTIQQSAAPIFKVLRRDFMLVSRSDSPQALGSVLLMTSVRCISCLELATQRRKRHTASRGNETRADWNSSTSHEEHGPLSVQLANEDRCSFRFPMLNFCRSHCIPTHSMRTSIADPQNLYLVRQMS